MSLPTNVKLSVQGHSRPGDTSHSIPKQAMIVRMTAETLDALQANPRMEFTFGPEPVRLLHISPSIHSPRLQGISIGDAFFPMRPAKENYPHDLYLRASSAAKPMAPLKLYANITGKFTVERDLATIETQIRATTVAAETKKNTRGITMLPGPPPGVSSSQTTKKGKSSGKAQSATSAFLKPIPQPRPSTSTSARAPSPLPPATPSPLRTAVVKALALKERSFDELVRLVENDGEKGKRKLVELLNQVSLPPSICFGSPDPSSDR
jgi:RNA polymerase II elongation factor ELL